MFTEPGLVTAMAWDNYDELADSIVSGKMATHDTMGLVYQNKKFGESPPELASVNTEQPPPTKRKRSFTGDGNTEVQQHMKTPKANKFRFASYEAPVPQNLKKAKNMDLLWLFSKYANSNIPMWRGYY